MQIGSNFSVKNSENENSYGYRSRGPSWHVWAMTWTIIAVVFGSQILFSFIPVEAINTPTLLTIITNFISFHVTGFVTILIILRLRVPAGARLAEACLDEEISLKVVHNAFKITVILVPLVTVLNIGILAFMRSMNWPIGEDLVMNWFIEASPSIIILLTIGAVLIAPVAEEFMFRLVLFNTIEQFFGRTFANVSTSMIFAVSHLKPEQILPLFILATVLQRSLNQSHNILLPIAIHSLFNGTMVILVLIGRFYSTSMGM